MGAGNAATAWWNNLEAVARANECFAESGCDIRRLLNRDNYVHRIEKKSDASEIYP